MKDWRKPDKRYVLVVEEKHGTFYYDATGDALLDAAYKLFLERAEAGWYPDLEYLKDVGPEPYTKEQLEVLKKDWPNLHQEAWNDRENWLRVTRSNNNLLGIIRQIAHIKQTEDKQAAWNFINSRNGFEYEDVNIEELL